MSPGSDRANVWSTAIVRSIAAVVSETDTGLGRGGIRLADSSAASAAYPSKLNIKIQE